MADNLHEETEQMRSRKVLDQLGLSPDDRPERKSMRFNVAQCAIRLAPPKMDFLGIAGSVIDLSLTGVQCVSARSFAKDDPLDMELFVPAFKSPLYLRGRVCWVTDTGDGRFRYGIEFFESDEKTQAHLNALHEYEALRDAANFMSASS